MPLILSAIVTTQDSHNSSKPPSSDGLGRKRGRVKEWRPVHNLPEMRLLVCEHLVGEVLCPACGQQNVASFPGGVAAPVQYGPNVQALAVYLHQGQLNLRIAKNSLTLRRARIRGRNNAYLTTAEATVAHTSNVLRV